jgi:hypothetical protein
MPLSFKGEGQGEGNAMSSTVAARAKEKRPMESPKPLSQPTTANSGIRDNYRRGTVGDFLKDKIQTDSSLSIVSAYFTIYAFEALKSQLNGIANLRFLFGEPRYRQLTLHRFRLFHDLRLRGAQVATQRYCQPAVSVR